MGFQQFFLGVSSSVSILLPYRSRPTLTLKILWNYFSYNFSLCVVWHTRVQPSLWGMRVVSYPDIMDSDIGGHARMPNYIVRRVGDRHIEIEWKNSLSFLHRWLFYMENVSDDRVSLQTSCSSPGCSWLVSHVVWTLHTLHS